MIFRTPETKSEIAQAAKIESECLSTAWSESQIASLPEYAVYVAAFENGMACGIGSMYTVAGEGQIMNIAVSNAFRRRGIANGIMNELILLAKDRNCENITLEVAEDNISAISLYKKCGFTAVGRRNGFYNGKDALIMEKIL